MKKLFFLFAFFSVLNYGFCQTTKPGFTSGGYYNSGGTVTTLTVTTANGVSGTVANPTTTPAITLSVTPNMASATGVLPNINGGTGSSLATGAGAVVLATSPSLTGTLTVTDGTAGTNYGQIELRRTVNGVSNISAKNLSSGTDATSSLMAWSNVARTDIVATSSTYTSTGTAIGINQSIIAGNGVAQMLIGSENGSAPLKFYTDNFNIGNERLWLNNSDGYVGIGSCTVAPTVGFQAVFSNNGTLARNMMKNSSSGTLAQSWMYATNNDANTYALLGTTSTGFTTSGAFVAQQPRIEFYSGNNTKSLIYVATNSALGIYTNATERLTIAAGGDITATGSITAVNLSAITSTTVATTGLTSITTNSVRYSKVGPYIHVDIYLAGTSNSTSFTCTLPIALSASTNIVREVAYINDNSAGSTSPGLVAIAAGSATVTFYKDMNGGAWTSSGGKAVRTSFDYEF